MIEIVQDDSADKFLQEAGGLLYKNEAVNSLMLGLCEMIANFEQPPKVAPILLRMISNGQTVSAAIQTNPPLNNLVLTFAKKDQLRQLAEYLRGLGIEFPGVVGPATESEMFSEIWTELTHQSKKMAMGQKIYTAEKVIPPTGIKGQLKIATEENLNTVTQWLVDFAEESLPPNERKSFEEMKVIASHKVQDKWIYLWMVDGQAVSVAHIGRPTKNGTSVSGVFTPKPLRKNGYASAVVAGATQAMLSSDKKFCVLYTDLANPTSNKIYQDLGYQEVADSKHILFE